MYLKYVVLLLVTLTHSIGSMANTDIGLVHFQPMVAIFCGHGKYHNQYLHENKKWISDPDPKAICTKDKLEILEYCRKVYPKKDIRNIVESGKYMFLDNWCKSGSKSCETSHWVKPYRCLEGPFQSDALLVPEHCSFDHVHNQSVCQSWEYWNSTAEKACFEKFENTKLQSFAMLLPCGVGIFSGVEFVCCPRTKSSSDNKINYKSQEDVFNRSTTDSKIEDSDEKSDNNEDAFDVDDYYDSDYEEEEDKSTTSTTTTTTTTTERPLDYYLSHFDSNKEHDAYKAAQKSLEESHRDKVTKVMKEWSELEEKYQVMRVKDPKNAAEFKRKMTVRFQKTVEALEEAGSAQKRQLVSLHQQRVMTMINMRKKAAMDCYTFALDQTPLKTKRIEKCLQKFLRALEKDRTHSLHHYRHLLNSNTKQALDEKNAILDHLENLIRMGNQSILMLERVPSISFKIRDKIMAFWKNLRGIMLMTREGEQKLIERYEEEVVMKHQERERLKMIQEEKAAEIRELENEKKSVSSNQKDGRLDRDFDPESMEDERVENGSDGYVSSSENPVSPSDNSDIDRNLVTPKVSHMHSQPFHRNELSYSVRHEPYRTRSYWNGSIYITLAFSGIALLMAAVVGIILLRNHRSRSPLSQGFVEVDQVASPEERHVASMQINGYENPTYKYFEAQNA